MEINKQLTRKQADMNRNITTAIGIYFAGRNGGVEFSPLSVSEVALASIAEFGKDVTFTTDNWSDVEMSHFAEKRNWALNIHSDDEDFEVEVAKFNKQMTDAVLIFNDAISTIDGL